MTAKSISLLGIMVLAAALVGCESGSDSNNGNGDEVSYTVNIQASATYIEGPPQNVHLTAIVYDQDNNEVTEWTPTWTADGGTLSSEAGFEVDWLSPELMGSYRITAKITDDKGRTAEGFVIIDVYNVIWPLKEGNFWRYFCAEVERENYTMEVVGFETVHDTYCAVVYYQYPTPDQYPYKYFINFTTGLWFYGERDNPRYEPGLRYMFPGPVGAEWYYGEYRFKIVGKDLTVVTPAGVFEGCYQYKRTYHEFEESWEDHYLCPNVGIVKIDRYVYYNFVSSSQLLTYTLN